MVDEHERNIEWLAEWLSDPDKAEPSWVFDCDERRASQPGLFAWHGDAVAHELVSNVFGALPPGPLYVGRINPAQQLRTGRNRVRNTKASSLRCSLAAMLWDELELRCVDPQTIDPVGNTRLTNWMLEHLSVTVVPLTNRPSIPVIEADALRRLDPPLNLNAWRWSYGRTRLRRLRRRHLSSTSALLEEFGLLDKIRAAEVSDPGVVVPISRASGRGSRRSRVACFRRRTSEDQGA